MLKGNHDVFFSCSLGTLSTKQMMPLNIKYLHSEILTDLSVIGFDSEYKITMLN